MLRHALRTSTLLAAPGAPALLGLLSATRTLSTDEGRVISIDRSGLVQPVEHSHEPAPHKEPETELVRHLKTLIRVG